MRAAFGMAFCVNIQERWFASAEIERKIKKERLTTQRKTLVCYLELGKEKKNGC